MQLNCKKIVDILNEDAITHFKILAKDEDIYTLLFYCESTLIFYEYHYQLSECKIKGFKCLNGRGSFIKDPKYMIEYLLEDIKDRKVIFDSRVNKSKFDV